MVCNEQGINGFGYVCHGIDMNCLGDNAIYRNGKQETKNWRNTGIRTVEATQGLFHQHCRHRLETLSELVVEF